MMARKKLEVLQVEVSNSLEHRLSKAVFDPFILEIMEKDRRLIEAALMAISASPRSTTRFGTTSELIEISCLK